MNQACLNIISEYITLLEAQLENQLEHQLENAAFGRAPGGGTALALTERTEIAELFERMQDLADGDLLSYQRLESGEILYRAADKAERLYLIRSGAVKISHFFPDGVEATLELIGPGRCCGLPALSKGDSYGFQVEAIGVTEVFGISSHVLQATLLQRPELALSAASLMSNRLAQTQHWVASLGAYAAAERVAQLLIRLAHEFGQPSERGTQVNIRINQEDIARMVGTTRETVSHSLQKLRKSGAVIRPRSPYIVNLDLLQSYSDSTKSDRTKSASAK